MGRGSPSAWFLRISACTRWLKCFHTLSFAAVVSIICVIVGLSSMWSVGWVCCKVNPAGFGVL